MNKQEKYEQLERQVKSLIAGERDEVSVLANVAAALREGMDYFWVGFYLVRGDELWLGPFQGNVACYRIPHGRGVCGTSWAKNETVVVEDVEAFPGHIACSSLSRSEIVVPLRDEHGAVRSVLDIDSTELATFDDTDRRQLEQIMAIVEREIYHPAAS